MGTSGLDRYPAYARLRTEDPVHWSELLNSWVVTRYDDVHAGFVDERLSANRIPVIMSQVPRTCANVYSRSRIISGNGWE